MSEPQSDDLHSRLQAALESVEDLKNRAAAAHNTATFDRLCGKAEGINLALSYVDELGAKR